MTDSSDWNSADGKGGDHNGGLVARHPESLEVASHAKDVASSKATDDISPPTATTDDGDGHDFLIHDVSPNDTLPGLALKYNVDIDDIIRYNKLAPNSLFVHDTLKIPRSKQFVLKKKNIHDEDDLVLVDKVETPPPMPAQYITHIVQLSDTLQGLALKYGTTVSDIKISNKLISNNIISFETLLIPTSKVDPRVQPPTIDQNRQGWEATKWERTQELPSDLDDKVSYFTVSESMSSEILGVQLTVGDLSPNHTPSPTGPPKREDRNTRYIAGGGAASLDNRTQARLEEIDDALHQL